MKQVIFEHDNPIDLFMLGFWDGYCEHLAENLTVLAAWVCP